VQFAEVLLCVKNARDIEKNTRKINRPEPVQRGASGSVTAYRSSDWGHVLCLRAFFALTNSELNLLTFSQGFETRDVDRAEMHKQIRTIFLRDKAEAFGLVKPFHNAGSNCRHIKPVLKKERKIWTDKSRKQISGSGIRLKIDAINS